MVTTIDELRNKCRTCRYLARNEGNVTSAYCWQTDSPIYLYDLEGCSDTPDPICAAVYDGESGWEPLRIMEPYFGGSKEVD